MSIIYINSHDENIYDWTEKKPETIIKPKKYISIYKTSILSERACCIQNGNASNMKIIQTKPILLSSHKTMGYSETPLKKPCDFLLKQKGIKFSKISNHKCSPVVQASESIPKKTAQQNNSNNLNKIKNFKISNIRNIRNIIVKPPIPKVAFINKGSTYELCKSGMMPSFIFSPAYGKVPKYISDAKSTLQKINLQQKIEERKYNSLLPKGVRALATDERKEILNGMKKNWWETTLQFNTIPVIVDTTPMKTRKNIMELYLRQMEQDIFLIENNPLLYVCENDEVQ